MKKIFAIKDKVTITHPDWRGLKGSILCLLPYQSNLPGNLYLIQLDKSLEVKGHSDISEITVHEDYLQPQPDGLISYDELLIGEVAILRKGGLNNVFVFKQINGHIVMLCGNGTRPGNGWPVSSAQGFRFERIEQSQVCNLTRSAQ